MTDLLQRRISNPWAFGILLAVLVFAIPVFATMGLSRTDVQDTEAMERAGQRAVVLYCRDLLNSYLSRDYEEVPPPEYYEITLRERAHHLGRVTEAFPECRASLFLGEVIRHVQINAAYEQAAAIMQQEDPDGEA